jgi:hypothetical protein
MYRDVVEMAKSYYRVIYEFPSITLAYTLGNLSGVFTEKIYDAMGLCGKDFRIRLIDGLTIGVIFSAFTSKAYLDFRGQGFKISAFRYDDLVARPLECCRILMEYCGLPVSLAEAGVKGLDHDSQRNSVMSKSRVAKNQAPHLTPQSKVSHNELLKKYGLPLIGEDWLIEGTITQEQ